MITSEATTPNMAKNRFEAVEAAVARIVGLGGVPESLGEAFGGSP